jgi:hypothetical protein
MVDEQIWSILGGKSKCQKKNLFLCHLVIFVAKKVVLFFNYVASSNLVKEKTKPRKASRAPGG